MKNLNKTTKTVLLAIMLSAIVIPLTIMNSADAVESTGQNIIKTDTTSSDIPLFDDRQTLLKTYDSLKDGSEKVAVKSQLDSMTSEIQDWYDNTFDQEKYDAFVEAKQTMQIELKSLQADKSQLEAYEMLPWVSRSYDYTNNALQVTIETKYFTEENIPKYTKTIRSIVGDKIDLTLASGESIQEEACSNRDTGVCNPIKGGVQFDGGETASVMFKATYNSKTGFVTAGHAFVDTSGNQRSGANIYQSPDQTTDIGNLETNNLFINVATWCDCAFVSELSGSRSMDDGVYSLSDPNSTQNPYWNLLVTMSGGVSALKSGYVYDTDHDWQWDLDKDGTPETDVNDGFRAGYSSTFGDSGSPIISYNGKLVGMHVGSGGTFMEHSAITSSFPGLTWGF